MAIVRSIEFIYRSRCYYALVRKAASGNGQKFHVRIMNSDLEVLWAEHQVVIYENGRFYLENEVGGNQLKELREAIFKSLSDSEISFASATPAGNLVWF